MSVPFTLDGFLPYRISGLAQRLARTQTTFLESRFGLNQAEFYVLVQLQGAASVSVRDIHARLDLDKPAVSRAAGRLAARGLIKKRTSPADRRLVDLSLTGKGRAMVAELAAAAIAHHDALLARLGADAPVFLRGLETLSLPQDD